MTTMQRLVQVVASTLLLAGAALAGPLDRDEPVQMDSTVSSPATDMLRIPGVIGLDYDSAIGMLQDAGLNPRTETIETEDPRYAGKENMVVDQEPLPGGMGMYGTTVTVIYYAPKRSRGDDDRHHGGGGAGSGGDDGGGGDGGPRGGGIGHGIQRPPAPATQIDPRSPKKPVWDKP
jgi:uncharacterized membrane protein YgcG